MNIYAVRSDEADILEVYNSYESALNSAISFIREYGGYFDEKEENIEEIIENFKVHEYANILDFDISIYRLTLNE